MKYGGIHNPRLNIMIRSLNDLGYLIETKYCEHFCFTIHNNGD